MRAMPSMAVLALNRAGFGPRPGDVAAFEALAGNDTDRLAAWVAEQVAPDPDESVDVELHQRRNGLGGYPDPGFTTLGKTLQQLWVDHRLGDQGGSRPATEVRLLTLMRMAYSKWQLREVMVDFWFNHFNVYGFETYTRETLVHYDRDVLRPHVFGNFRDLLEAVARSTAMLYYLDNYTNTAAGPNENYARELFELHALGAENYLGTGPQAAVPQTDTWPSGAPHAGAAPAGYVDADVYEAARCLTGWGVDGDTGLFEYTDSNHDRFQKSVLNAGVVNIFADQVAEKDALDVFDLLAAHPGTGRHVARKLCRRLVGDDPPQSLVDLAADTFTLAWQDADQIKQVVETILLSSEFEASWGAKTKRPVEFAVSAIRACDGDFFFGYTNQDPLTIESDTNSLLSRLSLSGHTLFSWHPPNGFPDVAAAWIGTNPRVQCWRIAGWLVDQDVDGSSATDDFRLDVIGATVGAALATPNEIVDWWIDRIFGRPSDPIDRDILVSYLAAGGNPANPLDLGTVNNASRRRLRMLVGLMFMSPEFFHR